MIRHPGQQAYTQATGTTQTGNIIIEKRDPTVNDVTYPIGIFWLNTVSTILWYLNSQSSTNAILQSNWVAVESDAADVIETLTGNSGGPVGPDVSNNVNIVSLYTNTVIGNAGTNTLTITPTSQGYPVTPFVVGPVGFAGYQTIQSGLNAANAAGGGIVYVQPGNYTESLTLYDKCQVIGTIGFSDAGIGVNLTGVHTPPTSGAFVFRNIKLISATHIFSSAAAGTAHLMVTDSATAVTNGYLYNLLNWTGILETYDVNSSFGTNDGFVNNTGGATILLYSAGVGAGTGNTASISGSVFADNSSISCPVNYVTGASLNYDGCQFYGAITLSNNSTGYFDTCHFSTGAVAAITMSSSAAMQVTNSTITSSHNPSIAGSGAGTLTLGGITFTSNDVISGTLTLAGAPGFIAGTNTAYGVLCGGTVPAGPIQSIASVGTSGQILTSNGAGTLPSFQPSASVSTSNVQVFTSSGTYTPTAGLNYCTIEVVGGGGGGGGAAATSSPNVSGGAGGGGGGYGRITVPAATIGSSQTVTVGSGGTAGASGGGNGGNGGTSSVGAIIQATGGTGGGFAGSGGATYVPGGTGGSGGSGDLNTNGGGGGNFTTNVGTGFGLAFPGSGGNSIYGGGGINVGSGNSGTNGTNYGGGGSGGSSSNSGGAAGGAGADGIVVITEYI